MLTAWIICSTLLGLAGMFAELRKGANVITAVAGFVITFVLWPVVLAFFAMVYVLMWVVTLCRV